MQTRTLKGYSPYSQVRIRMAVLTSLYVLGALVVLFG